MSVRLSLLAILDQGPCYGYQLRHEFDRRTGSIWPLNVGQIYNTLERLERDGLVRRGETDAHGHVYWRITDTGSAEVARWLSSPVRRTTASRDEVAIKLTIAATLPGVDADAVISAQLVAIREHLALLRSDAPAVESHGDAESLARSLVRDAALFDAEAEERWLEHLRRRLAEHPAHTLALGLATDRPKRGRPAKPVESPAPAVA